MLYTQNEVMDFVSEEDVKFIRLAFFDAFGTQKNISIMPEALREAFECGISFDASAVAGFEPPESSDLFLHPDPSTIAVLPWRPSNGRVVRMYCDIRRAGGVPYEKDCRHILKAAVQRAAAAGFEISFGSEIEFYLFKLDESGVPTREPLDRAGYMDIAPEDKGENIRRNICFTLSDMGITPVASHHEEGPGQNEIDFRYSDALTAADNCAAFKWAVSSVATSNGMWADFSPKPFAGVSGSGFHINISAGKSGAGADDALLPHITAGILRRIKEITLFLNPTPASYERLGRHKAPNRISWGTGNRNALIRIPETNGTPRRAELRSPDPQANPYTAFALLIDAALEGIKDGALPPPEGGEGESPEMLPLSFSEAFALASKSDFVKAIIPQSFIEAYRQQELQR